MAGASYDRYNAYVALPQIEKDGQKTKESVKTVQGNVDELTVEVDGKANADDVYDKTETYSKTETDAALDGKANSSHQHEKSDITDFPTEYLTNASATSTTLTITKQDGSTVTFSPSGNTPADYVTAQGSSSGWYYRKWHSGRCELWGSETATYAMSTPYQGGYASASARTLSLPFSVSNAICLATGYAAGVSAVCSASGTTFSYRPFRIEASSSESWTFYFSISATY